MGSILCLFVLSSVGLDYHYSSNGMNYGVKLIFNEDLGADWLGFFNIWALLSTVDVGDCSRYCADLVADFGVDTLV